MPWSLSCIPGYAGQTIDELTLSVSTVAGLWQQAGGNPTATAAMVAVAISESALDAHAVSSAC